MAKQLSPYAQLQADMVNLAGFAFTDLRKLWSGGIDADSTIELLPDLIGAYGQAAGTIAGAMFDDLRSDLGVGKRFSAIVTDADPGDPKSLVAWALQHARSDEGLGQLIEGGVQRRISNVARDTLAESTVADPSARGWMRVGNGECEFCAMLIDRGAVYTKGSGYFKAHDNCYCQIAPVWDEGQAEKIKREFVHTDRVRTDYESDANKARVKRFLGDDDVEMPNWSDPKYDADRERKREARKRRGK